MFTIETFLKYADMLSSPLAAHNGQKQLELPVPGYGKADLQVTRQGNYLLVKSKDGKLSREIYCPDLGEKIRVKVKNGLLTIELHQQTQEQIEIEDA